MNAIIDMISDGIICKYCEEFIDGEAPGYERSCGCVDEDKIKDKKKKNYFKELFTKKCELDSK